MQTTYYKYKNILEKLLELIYPPKCGICGRIGSYLCKECFIKLKKKEIENNQYEDMYFIYKYENLIRDLIIKYKFKDASYLYKTFSNFILKNKKICNFIKSYDIIIPVPLHRKRKTERGYNQAELIIKDVVKMINIDIEVSKKYSIPDSCMDNTTINGVAKLSNKMIEREEIFDNKKSSNIKFDNTILKKITNIKPQSLKKVKSRIEDVKGAYIVDNQDKIKDKNILIFDDIYTTGSTCNECKKVLLESGARKVAILALAKDYID